MKPGMNEKMQDVLEWGILHDALPQAAQICYELWAVRSLTSRAVPIDKVYRKDEERGPIILWWDGRPADKISVALAAGSITYSFNHSERNGIHYYETKSFVWKDHEWIPGPKERLFITSGGMFSKPQILDEREGLERWLKGR